MTKNNNVEKQLEKSGDIVSENTVVEENSNFENNFTIDIPKKDNAGEDAPPLLIVTDNQQRCVVGVFDGMGGSGSKLYEENGDTHTGAYLASRVVKNTVEQFFKECINAENFEIAEEDIVALKDSLVASLQEKLNTQNYEKSGIVSNMVRTFPTTMAVGLASKSDENLKINLLWAGDSRVYLLSAEKGLVQFTKDDLKAENDPFQNIENDSPLSNMINLDQEFQINSKEVSDKMPAILFAVTDGCFQFFKTPMHFENMLLQTMQNSNSIEEWKQNIAETLKEIAGDDCTLSLACLSKQNANFTHIKEFFKTRNEVLYCDFIKEINEIEQQQANETQDKDKIEQKRKEVYKNLWEKYKLTNYSLFNTETK
jgi:serine/threonine protein phosphatase PrpC